MKFFTNCIAFSLLLSPVVVKASEAASVSCLDDQSLLRDAPKVSVPENLWLPKSILAEPEWGSMKWKEVEGCCQPSDTSGGEISLKPAKLGKMPQFPASAAVKVLQQATKAWKGGAGEWTQMTMAQRIEAITSFFDELKKKRESFVEALMWEIGKNRKDAESEFDRTIQFAMSLIDAIRSDEEISGSWQTLGSTKALIRRAAIGVILCLGPYNYPLNETYATLIPALLMGNICIMKIPTIGGLVHLLSMEAFAKTLPEGTISFISGSGRETMPPLMKSGLVDGLAFIGGSEAADQLIKDHPHPHRLKVFLQLEANNMAIYLDDLFDGSDNSDEALDNALTQAISGSLSYNGQRCTALKLHMVPTAYAETFAEKLATRVEARSVGLPWQQDIDGKFSAVTPLPNQKRILYMKKLMDDAIAKGAKVLNKDGGMVIGGAESTLMVPAVMYPVTPDMELYHVEQFGPLVPVTSYDSIDTVLAFGQEGPYAQQVSIFGKDSQTAASLLDRFSAVFGKINFNSPAGRSPDALPFSGRRSSAMGVMSVRDALREFSVPTVVSYKTSTGAWNDELMKGVKDVSKFLESVN